MVWNGISGSLQVDGVDFCCGGDAERNVPVLSGKEEEEEEEEGGGGGGR